jgi:RimJ/RimL family protein N-acetyltransferase
LRLGGGGTIAVVASTEFVPASFDVPLGFETELFRLEPLGPEHNDRDYAAWSSSRDHISATPGWEESTSWPREMTPEENLRDLERHADDFRNRAGFTYTVRERPGDDVIGCVYIYPARGAEEVARVLSWVRADRAELDATLWRAVSAWVEAEWPFRRVDYAPRG